MKISPLFFVFFFVFLIKLHCFTDYILTSPQSNLRFPPRSESHKCYFSNILFLHITYIQETEFFNVGGVQQSSMPRILITFATRSSSVL